MQQTLFDQDLSFGKTSQEFSQRATTPLAASWRALSAVMSPSWQSKDGQTQVWFMDHRDGLVGASLMPNTSDWPNDASVCSLSQVLETEPIPQKYFLSGKACAGILRRAEKRGKTLPDALRLALQAVANQTYAARLTDGLKMDQSETSKQPQFCTTQKAEQGGGLTKSNVGKCVNNQTPLLEFAAPVANPLLGKGNDSHAYNLDNYVCQVEATYVPLSFAQNQRGEIRTSEVSTCLNSGGGKPGEGYPALLDGMAVRRLTPLECERLQGFSDGHTKLPGAADGPRYKAIGNSMAVPVMRWIAERIKAKTA